ncbi:MAG: LysR family transcriptional regulator [Alphaproteobacteria bacterium]|nr:LysR family transcriptional regulator [Alphaproteobacteria bacterium SS10]
MRSLTNVATFVQVANAGSFAEASARLGISTSATSKAVQKLEEELGVKLFHRTTRSVSLTVEGERFFEGASQLLDDMDSLTTEIADSTSEPRGKLVVSAPAVFGRVWLTERVLTFMEKFNQVEIELNFDDRQVDLAADGVDLAVRLGSLADSSNLIARKLMDDTIFTCASPGYIERRGRPDVISDLAQHCCIHYRVKSTGRFFPFIFHCHGETRRETFKPRLVVNSVDATVQAVERGIGIAQLPAFLALPLLQEGRLVEVLKTVRITDFPYNMVYLNRQMVSPRIRALVDFLAADPPSVENWHRTHAPNYPLNGNK